MEFTGTGRTTDESFSTAGRAGDYFFSTLPTSFIESKQPHIKLPEAFIYRGTAAGAVAVTAVGMADIFFKRMRI
jgi:hypothetical protein